MKKTLISLSSCLLIFMTTTVQAQLSASSGSITSTVILSDFIELTATAVSVNATFTTKDHYDNGITNLNAVHLVTASSKPYKIEVVDLSVAGNTGFRNGLGTNSFSASKLLVRPAGIGSYTPMTGTATRTLLFNSLPAAGDTPNDVDYKIDPGYGNPADTYFKSVQYIATQL